MLGKVHRTNPITAEPGACQKVRRGIRNRDDGWSVTAILDKFSELSTEGFKHMANPMSDESLCCHGSWTFQL